MSTVLSAAVAGLVCGSIAAVTTVFLVAPSQAPATGSNDIAPSARIADGDVAAVVSRHETEIGALRSEFQIAQNGLEQKLDEVLAQLNRRPLTASSAQPEGGDVELAAAVRDALGVDSGRLLADPAFQTAVADAIARIEEQERVEREEERRQRELDQIEDRLARMRDELGLDQFQETEMRTIMIAGVDRMDEIREQMRGGDMDRDGMRTVFSEYRDEMNAKVQAVLAPDQYAKYEESMRSMFGGFGRQRGGGGGPGGGFGGGPGGGN